MARTGAGTKGSSKAVEAILEQYRGGKHTYVSDLGTTAKALPTTNLSGRKGIIIQNLHATQHVYLGTCIPDILTGQLTHPIWWDIQTMDGTRKVLKWTASGSGTNEYYATTIGGGDPGLTEPLVIYGQLSDASPGSETLLTNGTLGSLNDHEWDWGDNDSLGFSTVYFADATGDPDTESWFCLQSYTWIPTTSVYGFKLIGSSTVDTAIVINMDGSVRIFGCGSGSNTTVSIWEYR